MSKLLQYLLSILFICLVPVWIFLIAPNLLILPSNYSDKASMIHTENNRFDIDSSWTGKSIAISSSNIKTINNTDSRDEIASQFKVESLTGDTIFELNQKFLVDRLTRHNLPGADDTRGVASVLFPYNLSKKDIVFWPVEMGAYTKLKYIGNKTINKLDTYHFQVEDAIIDDTDGFEFLPLVPEKYRVDSKVKIDIFVDPLTGTIINYQDLGMSSYIDSNGNTVWDMDEWSNKYNEPTIADRVKEARNKADRYRLITIYIPVALATIGLVLLVCGICKKPKKKS